jgi:Tol biopolymer transport system component
MIRSGFIVSLVLALVFILLPLPFVDAAECNPNTEITRVSVASDGTQANGDSRYGDISNDGRYVAFFSEANNLVPGEPLDDKADIYVYDRHTCQVTRIRADLEGIPPYAAEPLNFSGDGRYIVFLSVASDLVDTDTYGWFQIYRHDRLSNETVLVSVNASGEAGYFDSYIPTVSDDGQWVVFTSDADNLVPDDMNNQPDVFARNMLTGNIVRLVADKNNPNNANFRAFTAMISGNGRYVVASFIDERSGLGLNNRIMLFDLQANTSIRLPFARHALFPSISGDGRYVAFYTDDVGGPELAKSYVYDRQTNTTRRIPIDAGSDPESTNLFLPILSADGRYIALFAESFGTSHGGFRWDIVLYNQLTRQSTRVSVTTKNEPANGLSQRQNLSGSGRYISFVSDASNLVADDTNNAFDIFVVDMELRDSLAAAPRPNLYTTATPTLTWNHVTWAVGYEIQVDDDLDFSSPVYERSFDAATLEAEIDTLPDATYYWRVRAVRLDLTTGPWSAIQTFLIDTAG